MVMMAMVMVVMMMMVMMMMIICMMVKVVVVVILLMIMMVMISVVIRLMNGGKEEECYFVIIFADATNIAICRGKGEDAFIETSKGVPPDSVDIELINHTKFFILFCFDLCDHIITVSLESIIQISKPK
jgi:hypothetical protein